MVHTVLGTFIKERKVEEQGNRGGKRKLDFIKISSGGGSATTPVPRLSLGGYWGLVVPTKTFRSSWGVQNPNNWEVALTFAEASSECKFFGGVWPR